MHQLDPEAETTVPDDDSLYPYVNNDIKYGLFEDIVDSYYLDSQIKDDFQSDHDLLLTPTRTDNRQPFSLMYTWLSSYSAMHTRLV